MPAAFVSLGGDADIRALLAGERAAAAASRAAAVDAIIERCRSGSVLMRTHWPDGVGYSIEPSGESVSSSTARDAIATGALVDGDDALLAGAPSQTWRAP